MNRCWILLGMMGAGKSSIGRALAELTGRTFVDTDLILQQRLGRPITQIFQIYGEDAFRDHESSVIRSLDPDETVVSTGGGAVLRSENWMEFKRLGITIYLDATLETLLDRLAASKKKRPLLQTENWEERARTLLESRAGLYGQADISVRVDDVDLQFGAQRVLDAILEYERNADRSSER